MHEIHDQLINHTTKRVLKKLSKKSKRNIQDISRDTKFYLAQRNMKAVDVFGPNTQEFLCL